MQLSVPMDDKGPRPEHAFSPMQLPQPIFERSVPVGHAFSPTHLARVHTFD